MNLPVMTFNLRIDSGTLSEDSWDKRSLRVAQMIRQFKPVLIGTQEGSRPMLELLKGQLSNYDYLGQGRRGEELDEYCAIFYDVEILNVVEEGQFWLSEQPEVIGSMSWDSSFPRICTWAHFKTVSFPYVEWITFNTHLDHKGQKAREEGILIIWSKMQQLCARKGLPAVLMGDLNAEPDNSVIRFLRGEMKLKGHNAQLRDAYATARPGATYHNFEGGEEGEPIDYIFTTPDIVINKVEIATNLLNGRYASDHYPVVALLDI